MTETNATPDERPAGAPEALEDLHVDDEAADQVTGGEIAQTTSTQSRGRYQLRLDEARKLL